MKMSLDMANHRSNFANLSCTVEPISNHSVRAHADFVQVGRIKVVDPAGLEPATSRYLGFHAKRALSA